MDVDSVREQLVILDGGADFLKLDIEYAEFPTIGGNIFGKISLYKRRLAELDASFEIDLIHVHAAHEFLSFSRKVLNRVPIIFHLHSHQGSEISKAFNYKLSAVIARRRADRLIAVSDEELRIIVSKGYPESLVDVVYNGFEPGMRTTGE